MPVKNDSFWFSSFWAIIFKIKKTNFEMESKILAIYFAVRQLQIFESKKKLLPPFFVEKKSTA
jgi:hypothetical protein